MRCIKFFDISYVNMILKTWHKTMIMIPLQMGNVDDILVLRHRYIWLPYLSLKKTT